MYYIPHSVEKRDIFSHCKKNSSNQLFSNQFSKIIAFTKFLRKRCESTVYCGKTRNSLSPKVFFRQISSLVTSLVKTLISRNFCQKSVTVNFHTVEREFLQFPHCVPDFGHPWPGFHHRNRSVF